jgi:hypothetical protein
MRCIMALYTSPNIYSNYETRYGGGCDTTGAVDRRTQAQDNGYAGDGHYDHHGNYIRDVGSRNYTPAKRESAATTGNQPAPALTPTLASELLPPRRLLRQDHPYNNLHSSRTNREEAYDMR